MSKLKGLRGRQLCDLAIQESGLTGENEKYSDLAIQRSGSTAEDGKDSDLKITNVEQENSMISPISEGGLQFAEESIEVVGEIEIQEHDGIDSGLVIRESGMSAEDEKDSDLPITNLEQEISMISPISEGGLKFAEESIEVVGQTEIQLYDGIDSGLATRESGITAEDEKESDLPVTNVEQQIGLISQFDISEGELQFAEESIEIVGETEIQEYELNEETGELIPMDTNDVHPQSSNESHIELCETLCEKTGQMIKSIAAVQGETKKKRHRTKRIHGEEYLGFKKEGNKYIQCERKPSRKMGEVGCNHRAIPKRVKKNSFLCAGMTYEDRKCIFDQFWALDTWSEKKSYVKGMALRRDIKKRRKGNMINILRKSQGNEIFLPKLNGEIIKVCRTMFLRTLAIGENTFKRWIKCNENKMIPARNENTNPTAPAPSVVPATGTTWKKEEKIEKIKMWLNLIPKVPSHYCRSSTNRKYVEDTFMSKHNMWLVYKEWCAQKEYPPANRNMFSKTLKEEKVSIHKPRKDQCNTCIGKKLGTVTENDFTAHLERKTQSHEIHKMAKEMADDNTLVITMDLQSVLLCPKLHASAAYYKSKLQLHNFTIYVLNNREVFLYTWHEGDGGVTSNEFTTCIVDFLQKMSHFKKIILISDGCNYQNRNKVLSSAISNYAKSESVTVEQIILEKGHTQMEADSVHSALEHYFKPPIYAPSDYITRMQLARPNKPYNVINVSYEFFLNYEELQSNLPSLRPGKKPGDPTVTDIRGLKYLPNGDIQYRLNYSDEWADLPQRRTSSRLGQTPRPKNLYSEPCAITRKKYNDLQELKHVISKDYHPFYDSLRHN